MTKKYLFLIVVAVLLLFPFAQGAKGQTTTPEEIVSIPRSTFLKAKQGADELVVARMLIASQDQLIAELRENKKLLQEKNELLESTNKIRMEQLTESNIVITSLKEEKKILTDKNASLERSNKRWKKVAKVAGSVALAFIVPRVF
jgi:ABC-type proline/glycine betaine transport system ATPase subunit